MTTSPTWINELFLLPRPEYSKQPEALLTDLLWRSEGSSLFEVPGATPGSSYLNALGGLPHEKNSPSLERIIPRRTRSGIKGITETLPLAEDTSLAMVVDMQAPDPSPLHALLESSIAPQARQDRSFACVPLHPDVVVLQTLSGLVNKENPPNLARSIEAIGWMGGSGGKGDVAAVFLRAFSTPARPTEGLTGLLDALFPAVASHVWTTLPTRSLDQSRSLPPWPGVHDRAVVNEPPSLFSMYKQTPFSWFWEKWLTLCDPSNGWHGALPIRRFIDWATCLLRTALAFSYLWEANFFVQAHTYAQEKASNSGSTSALDAFRSMLQNGTVVATIESRRVPASQKHVWSSLSMLLESGYTARELFKSFTNQPQIGPGSNTLDTLIGEWIDLLPAQELNKLAQPLAVQDQAARLTKEFVRYSLLPRASDDDSSDQADFYYVARASANSRYIWFEPGPEWLVVISSLLARQPGKQCTLGMLLRDLGRLGIRIERSILVGMLEQAGLSIDSPDADNAVLIRAGF